MPSINQHINLSANNCSKKGIISTNVDNALSEEIIKADIMLQKTGRYGPFRKRLFRLKTAPNWKKYSKI